MIRTLLLDVINRDIKIVMYDVEKGNEQIHKWLNCNYIETPHYTINGREFDVIVDADAFLKDELILSASSYFDTDLSNDAYSTRLVGNLLFLHYDNYGEPVGLTDDDIEHLKDNIITYFNDKHEPMPYLAFDMDKSNLNIYIPYEFILDGREHWYAIRNEGKKYWKHEYDDSGEGIYINPIEDDRYFIYDSRLFHNIPIRVEHSLEDAMNFSEWYADEYLRNSIKKENVIEME